MFEVGDEVVVKSLDEMTNIYIRDRDDNMPFNRFMEYRIPYGCTMDMMDCGGMVSTVTQILSQGVRLEDTSYSWANILLRKI